MKVRIPTAECALLYGPIPVEAEEKLSALSIPVRRVSADGWNQTIGFCAGMAGFARKEIAAEEAPEGTMLVLQLSKKRLDDVLVALKGIPTGPKAMVTAHNIGWTGTELYRELVREREEMRKRAADR